MGDVINWPALGSTVWAYVKAHYAALSAGMLAGHYLGDYAAAAAAALFAWGSGLFA